MKKNDPTVVELQETESKCKQLEAQMRKIYDEKAKYLQEMNDLKQKLSE